MSGMLLWKREDVERLMAYGVEIMWVKDQGTYLMVHKPDKSGNDVVYAYDDTGLLLELPDGKDRDEIEWDVIYETCRVICGGDDFAEYLRDGLPEPAPDDLALMMQVTETEFLLSWVRIEPGTALRERTIVGKTLRERILEMEELRKMYEAQQ